MTARLDLTIGLGDMAGTRATVSYSPPDVDGGGLLSLVMACGAFTGHACPTPGAARQVAGALLDAADRMDADEGRA